MTSPAGPQAKQQLPGGPKDKISPAAGSLQQEGAAEGAAAAAAAAAAAPASQQQQQGSPSQQQQLPQPSCQASEGGAVSAEEAVRRQKRREAWEREQEGQRRWDLQRRLADISTDVEFLAREVRVGTAPCCGCKLAVGLL